MLPTFHDKPLRMGALAWYPFTEKRAQQLTLASRFGDEVKLYDLSPYGEIGVPRGLVKVAPPVDNRSDGFPAAMMPTVPPRNEEQARVIAESVGYLKANVSHVLRATTGFGKTFVGITIAAALGRTTLIIVTKEDLMGEDQWRGAIKKFTNCTDSDIGLVQGDKFDYIGKRFVLAMVHTLVQRPEWPEDFLNYFGFVIFDEVHRMGAETFSRACAMFPARKRLGLSATPERVDGKDFIVEAHIGPVMVESDLVAMKPKVLMQYTAFKMPKLPYPISPGKMMPVYKQMVYDIPRNTMIINFVKAAWGKGRKIIVFSDLKDHLTELESRLLVNGFTGKDIGWYVGGMSEKQRAETKKKYIILATYAMTSEATDIPTLDTAVFATPRANVQQAIGRILRIHPDKKEPVLLDLVDRSPDMLEAFGKKRAKTYATLGAQIVWM